MAIKHTRHPKARGLCPADVGHARELVIRCTRENGSEYTSRRCVRVDGIDGDVVRCTSVEAVDDGRGFAFRLSDVLDVRAHEPRERHVTDPFA